MGLWRDLFGPSKEEAWRELAAAIGAEFVTGGWWEGARVEAKVGEWIVTLDTYTVSTGKSSATFTRMRAPYRNPSGFRFKVFVENGFAWVRNLFGLPDITIGEPAFDDAYVIQGNDPERLKKLFANDLLREKLMATPEFWIEVRDDEGWFSNRFPEGVDELYFQVGGVVRDQERLKQFFELFSEVLHQLWWIDGADKDDPGVALYKPKDR